MINNSFVNNFKKINKKNPEGISKYENNFLNTNSSDTEVDSDSDNNDDCGNLYQYDQSVDIGSETDASSVCSEHSEIEEETNNIKTKFFKTKNNQPSKFKLLQEESDFEEEL